MKSYIYLVSICIIIFLLTDCTSNKKGDEIITKSNEFQVKVEDPYSEYELNDSSTPLAQILNIEFYNGDDAIILDNAQRLYLFKGNKFIKLIGNRGDGPCEYKSVIAYTVKNNIIYIVDRNEAKLIAYDIITNKCVREVKNRILASANSILKVGSDLYFTRGILVSYLESSTSFLYKMNSHSNLDSLNISVSDLDALLFNGPVKMRAKMCFADGKLFFYYPLSRRIFSYNIDSDRINYFEIPIDFPENIDPTSIKTIMDMLEIINNTEMIIDLYLLDQFIAIVTKQGNIPDISWKIKFFDYQGYFIGDIDAGNFVIDVRDNSFRTLKIKVDEHVEFPYQIVKWNYKINENTDI